MKRNCLSLWSVFLLLLLACSCRPNVQRHTNSSGSERELPLPEVPSTYTDPEQRAAYILEHFWNGMDFCDTLRSHDTAFMEQNLVNFLSLFPHVRKETLSPYIGKLQKRAAVDSVALNLVNELAELYLNDPNSPMRNEEYYVLFLEELLCLPELSEYDRIRFGYQLRTAQKNRPGTVATDFTCISRKGNRLTLHGIRSKRILLLFYDPACSHCSEILENLHENPLLDKLIANKELTVFAVYTEGDRRLWDETKDSMPQEWIVTIDDSHIVEHELYSLPAMPIIYLLDKDKKVELKDPSLTLLESFLSTEQP